MRRNKYLVFISIGFELVVFILLSIYAGDYLVKEMSFPEYTKALFIVGAFIIWFISLILKLKKMEK